MYFMATFSFSQTHLEVLKTKDVQDADWLEVVFAPDADIELGDDPVETLGIKCHGHGVSGVHRLQEEPGHHSQTTCQQSRKGCVFSRASFIITSGRENLNQAINLTNQPTSYSVSQLTNQLTTPSANQPIKQP